MSSQRRALIATAVAATVIGPAAVAVGAPDGAHTGRAAVPVVAASKAGGWHQVSTKPAAGISDIGLARFGSALQPVWVGDGPGDNQSLYTRAVSLKGTTSSAQVTEATWATLNTFPQIFALSGSRAITFSGLRSTSTSDPYESGNQYLFTSPGGESWTLSNQELSYGRSAYGSYGSDVVSAGGTPVLVYTNATADAVSVHSGTEPLGTTGTDSTTTPEGSGADVYDAGDGYDAKTGAVWAVWQTLSGAKNTEGISAQQVLPSRGTRVQAPRSAVGSHGTYSSASIDQRLDVAARPAGAGGGLYAAFPVGYPDATHVELWRLGASKALTVPGGKHVTLADVTAGPGGRLWVFWYDEARGVLRAARTNPAATRLGTAATVSPPAKNDAVYKLAGDGSAGPLTLFVNAGRQGGSTQISDIVIDPSLTVTASPHTVRAGGTVTVTVKDAGDAVPGANVSLLGDHDKTSKQGTATFHVARSAGAGKHPVVAKAKGYLVGHASVAVQRKK